MSARVAPLVLTAATLLAACSHNTPPATTPAPQQQASAPPAPAPTPVSAPAPAPVKADDSAIRSILTQMTFFSYDKSELSTQDQSTLAAKVPILAANPSVTIRVAGNCDDRGSDEYNLALGQRRAQAAKRYLTEHGISDSRIATISYGKERPISSGETEAAWAQNRNDQFEVTSGDILRSPNSN